MYSGIPFVVCYNGEIEMLSKAGCATIIPSENAYALKEEICRFREMDKMERRQMGLLGKEYLLENLTYKKHADTISKLI